MLAPSYVKWYINTTSNPFSNQTNTPKPAYKKILESTAAECLLYSRPQEALPSGNRGESLGPEATSLAVKEEIKKVLAKNQWVMTLKMMRVKSCLNSEVWAGRFGLPFPALSPGPRIPDHHPPNRNPHPRLSCQIEILPCQPWRAQKRENPLP